MISSPARRRTGCSHANNSYRWRAVFVDIGDRKPSSRHALISAILPRGNTTRRVFKQIGRTDGGGTDRTLHSARCPLTAHGAEAAEWRGIIGRFCFMARWSPVCRERPPVQLVDVGVVKGDATSVSSSAYSSRSRVFPRVRRSSMDAHGPAQSRLHGGVSVRGSRF